MTTYVVISHDKNRLKGQVTESSMRKDCKVRDVNLGTRECSCGDWDINGIPCRHAAHLASFFKLDISEYQHRYCNVCKFSVLTDNRQLF